MNKDILPLCSSDTDRVREAFPRWRVIGAHGSWFAVRGGVEHYDGPRSLLRCSLSATTLAGLIRKLRLQEIFDGLTTEELDEVWRRATPPERPRLRVIS